MKIGIVGGGVVGAATARAFIEHVEEVRIHDRVKERCTHDMAQVLSCDIVMICLPTPQKKDSLECDTSVVEEFFSMAASYYADTNFVLRSTVPAGFTRRMAKEFGLTNLVHSPEFLTARCAIIDAQIPSRNIIGIPNFADMRSADPLAMLYNQRWPGKPLLVMKSDESELVKLWQNSFFATKIAFWNEAYQDVTSRNCDWQTVIGAILMDGRIHPSHTQVPGHDGKFGFGPDTPNNCLRKDLANTIYGMTEQGLKAVVTLAAHIRNIEDRKRKS